MAGRAAPRAALLLAATLLAGLLALTLPGCSDLGGLVRDGGVDRDAGDADVLDLLDDPGLADLDGREADGSDDPELRDLARDPGADGRDHDASLPDLVDLDSDPPYPDADADAWGDSDARGDLDAGGAGGTGTWDDPYRIRSFPYRDTRDTRSGRRVVDAYGCAPGTDESGPELVYRIDVPTDGVLSVRLEGVEAGADPDVHLLRGDDPDAGCLARAHNELAYFVPTSEGSAGSLWVVVDTWVNGSGVELPGAYTLVVERVAMPSGVCSMREEAIELINRTEPLGLPALGPVVMEAHLVTVDDDFGGGWPSSSRDGIAAHYALSEAASGFDAERGEPWAPEGEGGSMWGQGATGAYLPVLDEAWYVNMYWRSRPARGTRMLVFNPANGRAVVASAGWETGPGDPTRIGGAVEEIHLYLGSRHLSDLVMGFLVDQTLDLGPIVCP